MKKNTIEDNGSSEGIRLNRFIADSGLCSRRQADKLIESEKVQVNGVIALLGQRINPKKDKILVNGELITPRDPEDYVYIALNKPRGITCTTDLRRRDNIISFMNYPERIFPIGRLDRDSQGLILLTNDGSIVNPILRAGNKHEKEYLVTVDRSYDDEFLQKMEAGVWILGQTTLPAKCKPISNNSFRIIIRQGLNRQIRRMCEALGYEVTRLTRLRIMHITLGTLKEGTWRYLGHNEMRDLFTLLERSSSKENGNEIEMGDD